MSGCMDRGMSGRFVAGRRGSVSRMPGPTKVQSFVLLTFAFAALVLSIGYGTPSADPLPWIVGFVSILLGVACVWRLARQ
jgi:hypothetical protein